jgi:hypothetical protein
MGLSREAFRDFLRSVFQVRESDMLCSEFFEALPRYVESVVAGRPASDEELARVAHHVTQCPECRETYDALLLVIRAAR